MPEFRGSERTLEAADLMRDLVAIPSVNPALEPGGAGEAAIADHCAGLLRSWGFAVEVHEAAPGRPSVLARHGRGAPALLFNGHLDTVGVGGMTVAPFGEPGADGRYFGRGSCDMKGGDAALLAAARDLARSGHPGTVIVALTADEEHASIGMADLIARGLRADAAVVCEPTSLAVMPAHKGFVWVEVTIRGRAAHGSRPEVGIDAVRRMGRFLVELDLLEADITARDPHPLLGTGSIHAGPIEGGTAPSVYPDRCTVVVERRTLPGESPEAVLREIEGVADRVRARHPDLAFEARVVMDRPGTEVARSHALVTGLTAALAECGETARVEPMTAWVDGALLNEAGTPAVCFGPGSIAQAHAEDEWVDPDEVERCAGVLITFARSFLAGG
ncbi:ArgE/DapE family deacylase [Gaopeijia maritima]|uniref:Probable succinyl-diaminopimelate desuccinylase n=1 Tax=Gaopeijia maritima TaxID=3119007 RepID=A0ABU9E4R6_9BACT